MPEKNDGAEHRSAPGIGRFGNREGVVRYASACARTFSKQELQ
jgi:hypothetical protein